MIPSSNPSSLPSLKPSNQPSQHTHGQPTGNPSYWPSSDTSTMSPTQGTNVPSPTSSHASTPPPSGLFIIPTSSPTPRLTGSIFNSDGYSVRKSKRSPLGVILGSVFSVDVILGAAGWYYYQRHKTTVHPGDIEMIRKGGSSVAPVSMGTHQLPEQKLVVAQQSDVMLHDTEHDPDAHPIMVALPESTMVNAQPTYYQLVQEKDATHLQV